MQLAIQQFELEPADRLYGVSHQILLPEPMPGERGLGNQGKAMATEGRPCFPWVGAVMKWK